MEVEVGIRGERKGSMDGEKAWIGCFPTSGAVLSSSWAHGWYGVFLCRRVKATIVM